ncbi:MAG: mechanosensitive ion channel family protein [Bacteroides sp.]|nr:mechanosensitive ion channel family protein [Bacteroides sp.]
MQEDKQPVPVHTLDDLLQGLLSDLGLHSFVINILDQAILLAAVLLVAMGIGYVFRRFLLKGISRLANRTHYTWDDLLLEHNVIRNLLKIVPAILIYMLLPFFFNEGRDLISLLRKFCVIYIIFVFLLALNGLILAMYDHYRRKKINRVRSLKGLIQVFQVLIFFIGAIVMIGVLVNKSPTVLFAGLGASAAIFSLVFKDPLVSFVAGVQLSLNDIIRPGDWVTLADQKTDGIVQEIGLITVKIKNFDNSISTVPPTVLLTNTFKNWREMVESGGRLVVKPIYVDKASVKQCTPEMLDKLRQEFPVLKDPLSGTTQPPTNTQVFRIYLEKYLEKSSEVNQQMEVRVAQMEITDRGVPIQLYFFCTNKDNKEYERIQSDIFDYAIGILPMFELVLK